MRDPELNRNRSNPEYTDSRRTNPNCKICAEVSDGRDRSALPARRAQPLYIGSGLLKERAVRNSTIIDNSSFPEVRVSHRDDWQLVLRYDDS